MRPVRTSRRIVVDASVARAAGEHNHPTSKACRDFLIEVLGICHKVVMSPPIRNEWKKHCSSFSHKWLTSMTARKKVANIAEERDMSLDCSGLSSRRQHQVLDKDVPLLEAALATDKIVVSLDDEARKLFVRVTRANPGLNPVMWLNPLAQSDQVVEWLKQGAKTRSDWQLGGVKE
ncbi:MAG: hypothetical protein HYU64_05325 [Armatimonadetes bacterium]|nr:hypothetical protein [Armatimonadota bacterium]